LDKIKEKQQQILTDSLKRTDDLLTKAENLELDDPLEKWIIHHCLLNEIPLLKELFRLCEYDDTEQIINRVRKIADSFALANSTGCYT